MRPDNLRASARRTAATTSAAPPAVQKYAHVLVLWLDDELFAFHPLTRLAQLIDVLKPVGGPAGSHDRVHVRVLGPATSTTLRALVDDPLLGTWYGQGYRDRELPFLPGWLQDLRRPISFYCSRATAADVLFLRDRSNPDQLNPFARSAGPGRRGVWDLGLPPDPPPVNLMG